MRLTVTGEAGQRMAEWRDRRPELAARALDRLAAGHGQLLADALVRFAAELGGEQP